MAFVLSALVTYPDAGNARQNAVTGNVAGQPGLVKLKGEAIHVLCMCNTILWGDFGHLDLFLFPINCDDSNNETFPLVAI